MDPRQALLEARESVLNHRITEARESLRGYWEWRHKGGFQPTIVVDNGYPVSVSGDEFARTLTNNMRKRTAEMPGIITLPVVA